MLRLDRRIVIMMISKGFSLSGPHLIRSESLTRHLFTGIPAGFPEAPF